MMISEYRPALDDTGGDPSGWPTPAWSTELSERIMTEIGAATGILSITSPGVVILGEDGEAAASLARHCNEFAAKLRDANPRGFGFFATLPSLIDVDAAIKEIRYALDELHADGVCLYTRYSTDDNCYLGQERFKPVWKELNSRKAVVFIHPTHSVDTRLVNPWSAQPIFDYPHETLRTAVDLILTGTKRANPDCKIILSHAGGTLPFIVGRVSNIFQHAYPELHTNKAQIEEDAKSFFYDLALSGTPNALKILLDWAPQDHILFGSDFPYAPRGTIADISKDFDQYPMDDVLRKKICYENAGKLFPRLAPK